MSGVLDASALLAYLHREPGGEVVAEAIRAGVLMSAANWSEVLSKLADAGEDPEQLAVDLARQGLIGDAVEVVPLTADDSPLVARLRPLTRGLGLSLADRVCLALAIRLGLPVLTADRAWASLGLDGLVVQAIRS